MQLLPVCRLRAQREPATLTLAEDRLIRVERELKELTRKAKVVVYTRNAWRRGDFLCDELERDMHEAIDDLSVGLGRDGNARDSG